jgi:hypothetical protein
MNFVKKEQGWYSISQELNGVDIANTIVEVIKEERSAPIRFDVGEGSEGRADVIGMHLYQQYKIQVEFDMNTITKELSVFYLKNQI